MTNSSISPVNATFSLARSKKKHGIAQEDAAKQIKDFENTHS